jgi:hypothetical protein
VQQNIHKPCAENRNRISEQTKKKELSDKPLVFLQVEGEVYWNRLKISRRFARN